MAVPPQGQQQKKLLRQGQKKKRFPWIRLVVTAIALLFITAGVILSLQGIIQSSTILTILGVIIGLCQWLFPIHSILHEPPIAASPHSEPQHSHPSPLVEQPPLCKMPSLIWNVPYQRNPFFTAREDILKHIYDAFTADKTAALTHPQAISGLGGIGKTQTAIEYAYRYRSDYKAVLWVKADSRETLVSDFVALADLLSLPEKIGQDQNRIIVSVKHWLETNTDWLLIFDNADDIAIVKGFIPYTEKGHILLTTCSQAVGFIAHDVEIDKMEPEEGALFLLRRAKIISHDTLLDNISDADRTKAQAISEILDGLPLALDQAGAYIEETACGLSGYLDLYQTQRVKLLKRRGRLAADHPEPVATTWSLSFEKVQQVNLAAAELLQLCAFLYPDAIPEEIISEGASKLSSALQKAAADSFELNATIEELRKFSLLRRDPGTKTLSIHRLVQAVLKDGMDEITQHQWAVRAVQIVSKAFPSVEFSMWQRCQKYLVHAQVCAAFIRQWDMTFNEAVHLLNQAGFYLHERACYAEAELFFQQALAIREKILGPEHPDVATSLNNLGLVYHEQGKLAQAEPFYQRALTIREKILGPEHPDVATSLNNLATLYDYQGKYAQAEPLYQRALAIREKTLGPVHPDVASTRNYLAELYRDQGQYTLAEQYYQQALAIREKTLGLEHPRVATSLENLALLYDYQGKYDRAEPLYQRALTILEKTLGPEHPNFAKSLNALALLYDNQGKYAQVEPLYQRALAIREKTLGPEHPHMGQSLNNIAFLYYTQGKYAQAEPLYQRALAIREKWLGPEHPRVALVLNNLAELYCAQGRYAEAEPFCIRGARCPSVRSSLSPLRSMTAAYP